MVLCCRSMYRRYRSDFERETQGKVNYWTFELKDELISKEVEAV